MEENLNETQESVQKEERSLGFDVRRIATFGLALILIAVAIFVFSGKDTPPANTLDEVEKTVDQSEGGGDMKNTDELIIEDSVVGEGEEAVSGKEVTVHYTGTLTNGEKFDSSLDRGQPFTFTLGVGQVIEGWDEGVKGMKVGGKRKLTIPGSMAYGPSGTQGIPPNATLVFDVELLDVE
ncbi:FKBP-type peptidyl-prolyl cis-trans isomerase [Candidatus Woesebacteria bacterium]|nr:MAG: FKBP-type peptidyl-prolyl cis-trans isomerase [Candidatus Woesebacteria bacterium]